MGYLLSLLGTVTVLVYFIGVMLSYRLFCFRLTNFLLFPRGDVSDGIVTWAYKFGDKLSYESKEMISLSGLESQLSGGEFSI
jgi:hypothetical protein